MKKYSCVFRNCNTIDTPGKGELPRSCALKGCTGVFSQKPSCKTFMRDVLEEGPAVIDFSNIRMERERRRHAFIFRASEPIPEPALLKTARA